MYLYVSKYIVHFTSWIEEYIFTIIITFNRYFFENNTMVFLATGRILHLIDVLCTINPSHLPYQQHDFIDVGRPVQFTLMEVTKDQERRRRWKGGTCQIGDPTEQEINKYRKLRSYVQDCTYVKVLRTNREAQRDWRAPRVSAHTSHFFARANSSKGKWLEIASRFFVCKKNVNCYIILQRWV